MACGVVGGVLHRPFRLAGCLLNLQLSLQRFLLQFAFAAMLRSFKRLICQEASGGTAHMHGEHVDCESKLRTAKTGSTSVCVREHPLEHLRLKVRNGGPAIWKLEGQV